MKSFTRSMRHRITQKADRSGWHLSKAQLLASDIALPILRICLRFYDDGRVQYPTLRAKRLGRKGNNRITGPSPHRKNNTEGIICQAAEASLFGILVASVWMAPPISQRRQALPLLVVLTRHRDPRRMSVLPP